MKAKKNNNNFQKTNKRTEREKSKPQTYESKMS